MERVSAEREKGNKHFKAGLYAPAEQSYAAALHQLDQAREAGLTEEEAVLAEGEEAKCRLNRCACLLRLEGYAEARAEAEAVLARGANAKAYFRLGQALERSHEPRYAAAALTQAIRLDPKAREPREALEAARTRLKAHPRLELVLDDLRLVEERAMRALVQADVPRSRQQMELMLKDARTQAGTLGPDALHWECRALLGLALVCTDEAESEAAFDYVAACRRRLGEVGGVQSHFGGDLRIETYHAHVSAQLCLDAGKLVEALPFATAGLEMAVSMRDDAMQLRLLGTIAAVRVALGEWAASEKAARDGLQLAGATGDAYGEAVCQLALGRSLHAQGRVREAAAALRRAFEGAFTLGSAHALASAHSAYAIMQLEYGEPTAARIASAMEKLQKAYEITHANGLRRAACDDAHNLFAAAMRTRSKPLADCIIGLRSALRQAEEIQYTIGRVRLATALALAFLGGADPGVPPATPSVTPDASAAVVVASAATTGAVREPLPGSYAACIEADRLLATALELSAEGSLERAGVYSVLALRHLLREDDSGAAAAVEAAREAKRQAAEAATGGEQAAGIIARPADDVNLGVALLIHSKQGGVDTAAMLTEAVGLLEGAAAKAEQLVEALEAGTPVPVVPSSSSAAVEACSDGARACRALAALHSGEGHAADAQLWEDRAERLQHRLWGLTAAGTKAEVDARPAAGNGASSRELVEGVEKLSLAWERATGSGEERGSTN